MHKCCNFLGVPGPGEDAGSLNALCSYRILLFEVTPEWEMEKCALKGDLGGRDEKVAGGKAQRIGFREFSFHFMFLKERPARSLVLTDSRCACYSTKVFSVFGIGQTKRAP